MPLKNGYEAVVWNKLLQSTKPLLLSTSGELVWSRNHLDLELKRKDTI